MYPRWTLLLLPYSRLELPAWNRLLTLAKVTGYEHDSRVWAFAPTKTIRGKLHGYLMKLDLTDWSQRLTYFLGRYYELHIQLLLRELLRNGDRVIDVGANIGMITLCASAFVGDTGIVESFEPNPECQDALRDVLALNRIANVTIYPLGLSDVREWATLSILINRERPSSHSGVGTLAHVDETTNDRVLKAYEVRVAPGDEILLRSPRPVRLIKIDVEGFEFRVLQGMRRLLATWHPLVITEFAESHLLRAGTSGNEIRRWMENLGYMSYGVTTRRRVLRHRLELIPRGIVADNTAFDDLLWVHASDESRNGLSRMISRRTRASPQTRS
jgi:FkbM family methyltransferase